MWLDWWLQNLINGILQKLLPELGYKRQRLPSYLSCFAFLLVAPVEFSFHDVHSPIEAPFGQE